MVKYVFDSFLVILFQGGGGQRDEFLLRCCFALEFDNHRVLL